MYPFNAWKLVYFLNDIRTVYRVFFYPMIYFNRSHCYFMRLLLFVPYNSFQSGIVHCISLYIHVCLYWWCTMMRRKSIIEIFIFYLTYKLPFRKKEYRLETCNTIEFSNSKNLWYSSYSCTLTTKERHASLAKQNAYTLYSCCWDAHH